MSSVWLLCLRLLLLHTSTIRTLSIYVHPLASLASRNRWPMFIFWGFFSFIAATPNGYYISFSFYLKIQNLNIWFNTIIFLLIKEGSHSGSAANSLLFSPITYTLSAYSSTLRKAYLFRLEGFEINLSIIFSAISFFVIVFDAMLQAQPFPVDLIEQGVINSPISQRGGDTYYFDENEVYSLDKNSERFLYEKRILAILLWVPSTSRVVMSHHSVWES